MTKHNVGYRDSSALTRWVRYALYAQIVVAVVSIFSGYLEYQLLSDYQNEVYSSQEQAIADGEANDQRQNIISLIYLAVFIASSVLILRWIHRANYNARQLGADGMVFTPGWSIGYYFIPILTLWKPYQAMKEIWKASKNPLDFTNQSVSGILPLWWTLWVTTNILGQVVFRLTSHADEIQEFMDLNIITQIATLLDIPLALVFLAIVNNITKMQLSHLEDRNAQSHSQQSQVAIKQDI
ncbi:DUF4328 domain-containing protein [Hahella sp. NBU794]|uniref:DUF4328 domain-containing protein n=1 Tax=Hahella sp. NBU794 TaxID=3422590 RepID=UPI003D6E2027